jgi:hypothetical protein
MSTSNKPWLRANTGGYSVIGTILCRDRVVVGGDL